MVGTSREHNQSAANRVRVLGESTAGKTVQRLFQRYESEDQEIHLSR